MKDIGAARIRFSANQKEKEEGIEVLKRMGITFSDWEADGRTCTIHGTYESIRAVQYCMMTPPRNAQ